MRNKIKDKLNEPVDIEEHNEVDNLHNGGINE
jgi:hypothetical protein